MAAGLVWDSSPFPGPWVGAPRSPSQPFHWISATSSQSRFLGTTGPECATQGDCQRGSAHPMPCNKEAPSAPPTQPVPNQPDHETLVQSPQHSMEPRSPGACSVMVLGQGAPSSATRPPTPGVPSGCLNKAESAWDTPLLVPGFPCQHGPSSTCQGPAGAGHVPGVSVAARLLQLHLWVSVGRGQGRGQGPHGPLSTPGLLGDGSQDSEGPGWGLSEGGRGEAGPWCLRHQGWTWVPPAGPGEA